MMAGAEATTIGLLRVAARTQPGNALATRLAVEALLAGADLRPPGLPPAAVLIVARLPAHRPFALRPGMRPDPAWERAARRTMAGMVGRAARPWASPAPLDCPAVLFSDEAELLACLVLDISLGRAAGRWWWRSFRPRWGGLTGDALPAVLLDQPALLPAMLRLLHGRGMAVAVVASLAPAEARAALRVMCAAHGIEAPAGTVAPAAASGQASPLVRSSDAAAPWRPWLSEAAGGTATLASEGEVLLGIALALAHAPAVARHPDFRMAVERWRQAQGAATRERAQSAGHLAAADDGGLSAGHPQAPTALADTPTPGHAALAGQPGGAPAPPDTAPDEQPRAGLAQEREPELRASAVESASGRPQAPAAAAPYATEWSSQNAQTTVLPDTEPLDSPPLVSVEPLAETGVATRLGGALFLIKVMQQLGLPECFEPEWRLASRVGPWGVLELLGRALLLDASRLPTFLKVGNLDNLGNLADVAADPLWAALAVLNGRQPGEAAGAGFDGPDHVEIPAFWAHWIGAASIAGRRVDLAGVASLEGTLLDGVSFGMRRWLAVVTPLLRDMLIRVLGADGDGDPVVGLLLRRGQLYVTPSHVDLAMPLDGVSLPVRLAGLDFDPGWLPAFGRVVQFHYEC